MQIFFYRRYIPVCEVPRIENAELSTNDPVIQAGEKLIITCKSGYSIGNTENVELEIECQDTTFEQTASSTQCIKSMKIKVLLSFCKDKKTMFASKS